MKFSIISVISGVPGDSGESTWPPSLYIHGYLENLDMNETEIITTFYIIMKPFS